MPGGHRPALGLRCRVGRCWTSATGRQHPRRQPRNAPPFPDGSASPSQSRLPPCQRLGCRLGRPLGNVPPGRSGPEGRAKPRLPLWGALVPGGHRPALDRAGRRECPPVGGGEGKLPAAPSHGLYRSAGGLPSQSRLPPPSGCGSLPAKPPRRQGKSLDKEEPLVLYW